MGWWIVVGCLEGSWGGWLEGLWGGWVCGGGVGGWRVHRVGAYTHPPMNSYNVKIFNFMKKHLPIHRTYPKRTLSLYIYFGGFMGWVVVGWLEGSWGGWVTDGVGGGGIHGVGGGGVSGWKVLWVGGCVVWWLVWWGGWL